MKSEAGERPAAAPAYPPTLVAAARPAPAPEPPDPPAPPEPGEPEVFFLGGGGYLGVRIEDVTEESASQLRLSEPYGALVKEVDEGSPADKAGLREGDVITSYQGQRVESARALTRMVRETPSGRTARVGYSRDGSAQTAEVKIDPRGGHGRHWVGPGHEFRFPEMKGFMGGTHWYSSGPRLGVRVEPLTPQLGEYFGVKEGKGILITEVMDDTPAEKAGLKAGDVIVRVEGDEVQDLGDLIESLRANDGKTVEITIVRDRSESRIKATLEKRNVDDEESVIRHREILRDVKRSLREARVQQIEVGEDYRRAVEEAERARREVMSEYRRAIDEARREGAEWLRNQNRGRRGPNLVAI
jgi:membrane-associated protease RseP (regulator of RpoE activity)